MADSMKTSYTRITVNGFTHELECELLSYEGVVALTGQHRAHLTVTYHGRVTIDGERYENNGSLIPGESIKIHDGMHFTAVNTSNA